MVKSRKEPGVKPRKDPGFVDTTEQKRLNEAREKGIPWKKWGPYLSERQWGTVREDYSQDGNAWDYFSHDQSRSRAYRWGEDGLGGISDDKQRLCFALALWNERDPILKERMFGLTNSEGNHGEDVKEYYFYLDSTPTHSYMKYLYKYPQREFPYRDLVETNRRRTREELEYELLDTGIFDDDRYFDVFLEYAKAGPDDILIRVSVHNRGPEAARLHLLPDALVPEHLVVGGRGREAGPPRGRRGDRGLPSRAGRLHALVRRRPGAPVHREREQRPEALGPAEPDAVRQGRVPPLRHLRGARRREPREDRHQGRGPLRPRGARRRLPGRPAAARRGPAGEPFGRPFDEAFRQRLVDADEFYDRITPRTLSEDERRVHRQALAGMLWTKQYYYFDLDRWLKEHQAHPLIGGANRGVRNAEWFHMLNGDVISMPDKWEYPWYAAWDLAFHTISLSLVDFDFAKEQLLLMLRSLYAHPNGQIPAYEWNFSDVNPPVHAWATLFLYKIEKNLGREDIPFLERSFQGLMLNFNWWVNRKDPQGRNVFAGGFLGLDNIGVFDRSAQLPTGGSLEQADGTAWMAFYCQNMLEMALILADHDPVYEEIAFKFLENFIWISYAMDKIGEQHDDMWDEEDGFYYDVLRLPDGEAFRLKVRSMVGLLPLCASTVFEEDVADAPPEADGADRALQEAPPRGARPRGADRRGLHRLRRAPAPLAPHPEQARARPLLPARRERVPRPLRHPLALALPPREPVRLPHGRPGVSRPVPPRRVQHRDVRGNSNWRGPVWMPVNALIVRGLLNLYGFYGDDFKVECPTGSGNRMTLFEVAKEISRRLSTHLPARRERPPPGLRRLGEVPGRPALARPDPLLRVLPRRQRGRPRSQPPDGLDGPHRGASSTSSGA